MKSRRAAPAKDLADMPGWKHDPGEGKDEKSEIHDLVRAVDSVKIRSQL